MYSPGAGLFRIGITNLKGYNIFYHYNNDGDNEIENYVRQQKGIKVKYKNKEST